MMSVKEAAAYLGLSYHTLNQWRSSNVGPVYYKFGRRVVYSRDDLEQFAEKYRQDIKQTDGNH